jgi:NAD(P)-dependent dehydrogenase (short-subunit alcohol dehydrogenase family)
MSETQGDIDTGAHDLAGRIALISGASGGIGRVIAQELAQRGAAIALTGRDRDALESTRAAVEAVGAQHLVAPADLGSDTDIARLLEVVTEDLGVVDVLINNAAMAGPTAPLTDTDVADFERTLRINLVGPFALSRAVVPGMRALGHGTIVNIGSIAGVEAYPLRSSYASSKWGLEGLTRTLAAELGPDGIRVNIVSPGPTEGARSAAVIAARAEAMGTTFDELRVRFASEIPLRRFVTPQEVARVVAFFASDVSDGVTGQSIRVSGGMEI